MVSVLLVLCVVPSKSSTCSKVDFTLGKEEELDFLPDGKPSFKDKLLNSF